MDRNGRVFLRVAVSGYLIYLAWQIFSTQRAGGSSMSDVLAYAAAAVLALSGAAFAVYALLDFRREKAREQAAGLEEGNHDEARE